MVNPGEAHCQGHQHRGHAHGADRRHSRGHGALLLRLVEEYAIPNEAHMPELGSVKQANGPSTWV